ncbi:hypothetical protein FPOAC2_04839 [Fusarium poae]|uniref:Major facilitator superfamily (MFS) profile domain-containing protein n=1 Tax=Fusarium poae TaxID=36050 RepID=A0A1B8ATQ3_FUSPO|nr:hypothetical protein FPOAC1_004747 [Fusarium poae]KAG8671497.1 hypothetical protein FPOAC1_004747 [Fusarium poae]OBS23744.1 hypothetical protein FPOA_04292 [Fusarium poae]
MDRDIEKTSIDEGTLRSEPVLPVRSGMTEVMRAHPRASVNLSRCQSQNGYSCNPYHEPDNDDGDDENAPEKDPFEVNWENGDSDPWCPRKFVKMRKWLIIFIVSSASLCVTAVSSIYTSTYEQMEAEFGSSREISILGLSAFVLGIGLEPMFLRPMSEFYGRRPTYIVSWSMYLVWIIPQAVAQNIETVIVSRFLDGFSGSAFLAVSGGTVGDLFTANEIQAPMLMFSIATFVV